MGNIITTGKFEKMSEYYNYLWNLGRAMLAYYRCDKLLTDEEVELITDASYEDKFAAMEYAVLNENNYKYKKNIYIRNTATINRVKRKKTVNNTCICK